MTGRRSSWPGVILLLALAALLCAPAKAGARPDLSPEERAWLDANPGSLTLWFDHNYPPIEFQAPDGSFAGIGADIMRLIEQRLGVAFVKTPSKDWNRQLKALESGESAIAPVIVRTPERERFARFSAPYITIPAVIITRRDRDDAASLDALAGRRVAVVQGFVSEGYLRTHYGDSLEIVPVKSVQEGLRDVSVAVVDAMVENLAVAAHYIEAEKLPNLKVSGTTDLSYAQSFAVGNRYPLLYSAMQKAMADISTQELHRIEQRWIHLETPGLSREMILLLRFGGFSVAALLLCLSGMSWWLRRRLAEKREELARTEKELQDKGARLNLALEAANDGLWDWDIASGTAFFSPRYYTMLGYEPGAFPATYDSWRAMLHPEDAERAEKAIRRSVDTGRFYETEFRMRGKSGQWVWILARGRVTEWDAAKAPRRVVGTHVDITARKEAEAALRETEARYRDIFENAPVAIFRATPGGRFIVVNPTYAAMAGFPSPEAMIEGITDIAAQMYDNPLDREVYKRLLAERGAIRDFEARLKRHGGGIFWASMTSRAVRDEAGNIVCYDGFLADVTERKRAEEDLRQARDTLELQVAARTVALREANERLMELDRQRASFLSSASHELRTPLTSVLGFAKLAKRTFSRHFLPLAGDSGVLRDKSAIILGNLSIIEQEGERLTRLINDLLDLNKIEAGRMEWRDAALDVAEEMRAAARAMQGAFAAKPGVRLSLQLAEDAGGIVADRDRLRQLVLNLLSNAIKYTDAGTVRLCAGPTPDGGLRIAVADTGSGVAEEDREHVFQKFYQGAARNPDDGKPSGTGLGLAICKNIVEHYGGVIRVESRPGHGSTFSVEFPPAIRP
jgi:PAS domain S-box-containing protein